MLFSWGLMICVLDFIIYLVWVTSPKVQEQAPTPTPTNGPVFLIGLFSFIKMENGVRHWRLIHDDGIITGMFGHGLPEDDPIAEVILLDLVKDIFNKGSVKEGQTKQLVVTLK